MDFINGSSKTYDSNFKFEFQLLAEAFVEYSKLLESGNSEGDKEFHGIRDFYFTVKYLVQNSSNEKLFLKDRVKIVQRAILKNFGGL
jgi:hypothetical protein